MNEIANRFLLAGDKFLPEMHLKEPTTFGKSGFSYSACGPFTKNKGRIKKKLKKQEIHDIFIKNKLDKACFQHDMAYGDFKDLIRRTASDEILHDKALSIAENSKYDGYQSRLVSMFYNFLDKESSGGAATLANKSAVRNKNVSNKELAEQLRKPIIRKFEKRKLHSSFIDNIWGAGLADIQLTSTFSKGIRFLLCVFDIFSKYVCVNLLKDKKSITNSSAFQNILDESNRKPNKIWVDKGSKFYNRSMKS